MGIHFRHQTEAPEIEGWEQIAAALRAMPTPPRPRGFEITVEQAAALRPTGGANRLPGAPRARRLAGAMAAVAAVALVSAVWSPWQQQAGLPGQTAEPATVLMNGDPRGGSSQTSGVEVPAAAPGVMVLCATRPPSPARPTRSAATAASGTSSPTPPPCRGGDGR